MTSPFQEKVYPSYSRDPAGGQNPVKAYVGIQMRTGYFVEVCHYPNTPPLGLSLGIGGLRKGSLGIPSSINSYSSMCICNNSYVIML